MKGHAFALLVLSFSTAPISFAAVQLASPFGDHMVLQRDQPVPVWGSADAGEKVTVSFAAQTQTAVTPASGKWSITLAPLATNATSRDLVVTGTNTVTVHDVLVGEVWLCGGQSNMERQLGPRRGQKPLVSWASEVASADHPLLRQLFVNQTRSSSPADSVVATWTVCSPETAAEFTAVGYYFGRDLQAHLGVPVGIIHSSWGGTPAEAWTSREGLADFPEFEETLKLLGASVTDTEKAKQHYFTQLKTWFTTNDPGSAPASTSWSANELDTADWSTMNLPVAWENVGHDGYDGIGWFRRSFDLPPDWAGEDLILHLGAVDDIDDTWLNGQHLGTTAGWQTPRVYRLPAALLKRSANVIAVRVLDTGGGGGIWDAESPLEIVRANPSGDALNLRGPWSYRLVADLKSTPRPPSDPSNETGAVTVLYNGMIAPLIPFAIRGVTFYQGEANADRPTQYRTLLPALINDWRRRWNAPQLPFLFVQIAPFEGQPPEIREAQRLVSRETDHTAMIVTLDVGDATDIHPNNKAPVGHRLSLAARALAYGENLEYSGPAYESISITGNRAVLHFSHTAKGLVAPGATLDGFTVAGADGVFCPATAEINGDTVVVTALEVTAPTAVRYAWANVASGNLFNTAGLPASPFNTESN